MAQREWTSFFSDLVRDFVSASAGANSIPTSAALPMVSQDATDSVITPRLVWTCETEPSGHPRVFIGTVTGALTIKTAKGSTAPATAAEWMTAVELRLRDTDSWSAYMAALPEATRTGWIIIDLRVMPGTPEVEPNDGLQTRPIMVKIKAKVLR